MKYSIFYISFLLTIFGAVLPVSGHKHNHPKEFVVVIDAGHGGHDPGAIGRISKEKNINLNVALRLGELIEENCKNTKVIYTRKKDIFIPLNKRAEIANDAKADLFISIHTNALEKNRTAQGASTWTLGLARSNANLEVAKRENSVILYENDYKTRYAGFNPNSAESYIIFEFMQDKYMEQSVHLASLVQKQFKNTCKRQDRGVHQAGFLVLKASAMPSILVELGFISTPEEERYLNSSKGIQSLSNGIYQAFLTYKKEQEARMDTDKDEAKTKEETSTSKGSKQTKNAGQKHTEEIMFKIQFMASSKLQPAGSKLFKGLKDVSHYQERGLYKYTFGESTDYNEIVKIKKQVQTKFKDAFIVAFKNGQRMDTAKAINEYNNNKNKK